MFLHNILNEARKDIVKAVRDYQDWLGGVHAFFDQLPWRLDLEASGVPQDWLRAHRESMEAVNPDAGTRWIMTLEEYEILFPETAECRRALSDEQRKIRERLTDIQFSILNSATRDRTVRSYSEISNAVQDQLALMEDVRVYIQNKTLSSITGNTVPMRKPPDPKVPRIVAGANGQLEIVTGEELAARAAKT